MVSLRPDLTEELRQNFENITRSVAPSIANILKLQAKRFPGLNDGLIIPGSYYPSGTPLSIVRRAALNRSPLRGTVRVIIVLVQFSDVQLGHGQQHFRDLFFSTDILPNGSVKEYYREVSNGLIDLEGDVVGPYTLAHTMAYYANGASGIGNRLPNARTMAREAAIAADPDVDFTPYDNDGNGFVDAFIVIHAGRGAEEIPSHNDRVNHIWSHKWVLSGSEYNADGTNIYGYLTVPEDCKIGVCCHELGHLLFGWPDLYDTDYSSSGLGNWCLMAGGSWNGGGDIPAHPSAWCKATQGWVTVANPINNGTVNIADVKTSHTVHRLWTGGAAGTEYFLIENRQRQLFDSALPGDGLLIWHIDDTIDSNSNENHPKIALMQADGLRELEAATNRGDNGDPFPGITNNTTFNYSSNPSSRSYAGSSSCVSVTNISPSAPVMTLRLGVNCFVTNPFFEQSLIFEKPALERNIDKVSTGTERFFILEPVATSNPTIQSSNVEPLIANQLRSTLYPSALINKSNLNGG